MRARLPSPTAWSHARCTSCLPAPPSAAAPPDNAFYWNGTSWKYYHLQDWANDPTKVHVSYQKDRLSPVWHYTSIYRMNPDGTGIERVASGVRNTGTPARRGTTPAPPGCTRGGRLCAPRVLACSRSSLLAASLAVGFDWHPTTKQLYFTDNGRDGKP